VDLNGHCIPAGPLDVVLEMGKGQSNLMSTAHKINRQPIAAIWDSLITLSGSFDQPSCRA